MVADVSGQFVACVVMVAVVVMFDVTVIVVVMVCVGGVLGAVQVRYRAGAGGDNAQEQENDRGESQRRIACLSCSLVSIAL